MSSGLYVPSTDVKWPAPGPGHKTDGRLCSACSKPSKSAGGGLIDGRWYCAACKPASKPKRKAKRTGAAGCLSNWMARIHDDCLRSQRGITPGQAVAQYGTPPTASSVGSLFNAALRDGWFRRQEWREQGAVNEVRRSRYFAVDKAGQPARLPDNRTSYFTGITRCRSIFELGDTL